MIKNYSDAMKILTVRSNNSVVSAEVFILFHNYDLQANEKKIFWKYLLCCSFGDRDVWRTFYCVINVAHPIDQESQICARRILLC